MAAISKLFLHQVRCHLGQPKNGQVPNIAENIKKIAAALLAACVPVLVPAGLQAQAGTVTIHADSRHLFLQPKKTLRYACYYQAASARALIGKISTPRITPEITRWKRLKSSAKKPLAVPKAIQNACRKFRPDTGKRTATATPTPDDAPGLIPSTAPTPVPTDTPELIPSQSPTPTPSSSPTPPPTATPNTDCASLPGLAGNIDGQVELVNSNPACAADFVERLELDAPSYLPAFYRLIPSASSSESLFFAVYSHIGQDRFRFSQTVADDLYQNLPGAVAACAGMSRCGDWNTYVLQPLLIGSFFRCPQTSALPEGDLLNLLSYSDYYCTDNAAAALASSADSDTIDALTEILRHGSRGWTRRNGARVLIRFWEQAALSNAYTLVSDAKRSAIIDTLLAAIASDNDENALHDIIYLLDAKYYPLNAMQPYLEGIMSAAAFSSALRFRAASAYTRLLSAKAGSDGALPDADIDFMITFLASDDMWVRAQIAYSISSISPVSVFSAGQITELKAALQTRWDVETALVPKVYVAQALDRFNDSSLFLSLKNDYETSHLGQQATASGITIRSGLPLPALNVYLTMLDHERNAFFDILGAPFNTPIAGDPTAAVTLLLFESPAVYQEYMSSFGPCCANAGGVYIESSATFYTFDRTPQQSSYTTEQLVKHEFGHYLNGRHLFPGIYGEAGYFDQPKLWADEGFAEVLAGVEFSGDGSYTLLPHNVERATVCSSSPPDLNALITATGYTATTYPHGWALAYYLTTDAHTGLLGLFGAYRDNTFNISNFASLAQTPSLAALQQDWHAAIDGWCSSADSRSSPPRAGTSGFPHFERPDTAALPPGGIRPPGNPEVDPHKPA